MALRLGIDTDAKIARLTADLATSRAETAMAFEVAAQDAAAYMVKTGFFDAHRQADTISYSIRALTPAEATAALADRDKVKDELISELRAEVARRSEMHECAMAERDDCILDWSDTKAERDRLAAEVERLAVDLKQAEDYVDKAESRVEYKHIELIKRMREESLYEAARKAAVRSYRTQVIGVLVVCCIAFFIATLTR